jgi:hypothetical protein
MDDGTTSIYFYIVTDPTKIDELTSITPYFGDHLLVLFKYSDVKVATKKL